MTWYELWLPADAFQVRGAGSCELRRHAGVNSQSQSVNSQQSLSAAAIISRILTRWDFDAVLSVCWSSLLRALGPPCVLLMKILTAGRPELCIPEAQVVKSSSITGGTVGPRSTGAVRTVGYGHAATHVHSIHGMQYLCIDLLSMMAMAAAARLRRATARHALRVVSRLLQAGSRRTTTAVPPPGM
jgi:hypothetical protein